LQLYNLEKEIGEKNNLADKYPDKIEQMKILFEEAYEELGNYDRIRKGVRFFEEGEKWPNLKEWRDE